MEGEWSIGIGCSREVGLVEAVGGLVVPRAYEGTPRRVGVCGRDGGEAKLARRVVKPWKGGGCSAIANLQLSSDILLGRRAQVGGVRVSAESNGYRSAGSDV